MSENEENEILKDIHDSNIEGIKTLHTYYYQSLCVYALKYMKSQEEVEDIIQEVFISLWEKRKTLIIKESLESYLFVTVKNKCLNKLRDIKNKKEDDVYSDVLSLLLDDEEEEDISEIEVLKLQNHLSSLSVKKREVLEHIVLNGLKYKEVAEEMDVSINTVKTHFRLALKELREIIELKEIVV